jgi:hyperosmotically inducible protein
MNTENRKKGLLLRTILVAGSLLGLAVVGLASNKQPASLSDEVRHQILMLPYYNVFNELSFTIDGSNTVVLNGEVTGPTLKADAEAAVRSVKGVGKIVNSIEVLPLSPFDNAIRLATYRAIFSRPGFEKYAIQPEAPIRIIVKNGNVTLEGFVNSALDKQMAEMAARMVPGVFSVTDNLEVS